MAYCSLVNVSLVNKTDDSYDMCFFHSQCTFVEQNGITVMIHDIDLLY